MGAESGFRISKMLKTCFGRKGDFLLRSTQRNVAVSSSISAKPLGKTAKAKSSDENIFKKRQPVRDSPFSGRIYDTLMKEFDADAAFDARENIEIEQMKAKNPRYNARGNHAIVRTKWWLGQGRHFIPEI